jgi:hypothetical protein
MFSLVEVKMAFASLPLVPTASLGLLAIVMASLVCVSLAQAELTIRPGSFKVETSSTQAGAHADVTTSFAFMANAEDSTEGDLRTTVVDLPTGFAGSPVAVPTCAQFQLQQSTLFKMDCPLNTQVGVTRLTLDVEGEEELTEVTIPVYNMVPGPGEAADFGFILNGIIAGNIAISVRAGDNGVRATATDISGFVEVDAASLTLWGVPASSSHDEERGEICFGTSCFEGDHPAGTNATPFLDNPTRCTNGPLEATLGVNSWRSEQLEHEDRFVSSESAKVGPFTGCEHLRFDPKLSVQPTLTQASSPAGYNIGVELPQNEFPEGLATADLRNAVVKMPVGTVLSPSAANGLQACAETGPEGIDITGPESEETDIYGHRRATKGKCPLASELALVRIFTPAFANPLEGHVYLEEPLCGNKDQPEWFALRNLRRS